MIRDDAGELLLGGLRVRDAIAGVSTPAYVYDLDAIAGEARDLEAGFGDLPHGVFYAVKANSAGPIVRALAACGCGADVVSGAELLLALRCGIDAEKIVFSGVAKGDEEIDIACAAGERGIHAIQVESIEEIARVDLRARAANRVVRVAFRINPGVDIADLATHAHVATGHDEAKFGIAVADLDHALAAVALAKNVELVGVSSHVGSQFLTTAPYLKAARVAFDLARRVRERFPIEFVDTGGGFGVDYLGGDATRPAEFVRETIAIMRDARVDDLALHVEPGRALVARHGVLAARVIQRKVSPSSGDRWLLVDAGMNDLIRPALYQAKHRVVALLETPHASRSRKISWRVVGPICESSDDFGSHDLPDDDFDHVALLDAGAYGYTMASRYNGRAIASEVFIRGGRVVASSPRAPLAAWADERAHLLERL